jgi:hypothetical protein
MATPVARDIIEAVRARRLDWDVFGPDVKWYGAKGDGTTDDTASFTAAFSAARSGSTIRVPPGKYYLASSITIPEHVTLLGPSESIGSKRSTRFDYTTPSSIRLANAASIIMSSGSAVSNLLIVNNNLIATYPISTSAAALAAIAAFAGTAISMTDAEDCYIGHCRILGFAQAIKTNNSNRQKIEWLDIDCTAGIWFDSVFDITRVYNVHCWPFLTYGYSFSTQDLCYYRSGSCFKTTTHFDGSSFHDCFSYGHQVGFDIQTPGGIVLNNCWVEGGGASYIANQYGFSFTGATTDNCMMIGCGSDTSDSGVYVNTSAIRLLISNCQIFSNVNGIQVVNAFNVNITGCNFYNSIPSPYGGAATGTPFYPAANAQIFINGSPSFVSITGNYINALSNGGTNADGIKFAGFTAVAKIANNTFRTCNTSINGDASTTGVLIITGNSSSSAGTDVTLSSATALNKVVAWNNRWETGDTLGNYRNITDTSPADSYASFGGANGPKHYNYYAKGTSAAPTILAANDVMGYYRFYGHDGNDFQSAAAIRSQVDSAPAAGSMPGNLIFSTTPSGAVATTDRWAVDSRGNMRPLVTGSTTATGDFLYVAGAAGVPTGVPGYTTNGFPTYWDSTNLQLYVYSGGAWKKSAVFT